MPRKAYFGGPNPRPGSITQTALLRLASSRKGDPSSAEGLPSTCDAPVAPCSNPYDSGGCRSQAGTGSFLYGSGTSSVAADDLVLHATELPTQKLGLFFMGPAQALAISGNGLRCIAGGASGLKRFPAGNSGAAGVIDLGPGIVAYSQAHFPASSRIQSGQTWNFQCFYRDPAGPCGATSNTTNGFSVTFTP